MRAFGIAFALLACLCSAQDKPNAALEPLGFLIGDWEAQYTRKAPDGKEDAVTASVHTRWRLQGQLLEIEETQTVGGKSSTTLLLLAYDDQEKVYRGQAINSVFPTLPMSMKGTLSASKLTLAIEDPIFGGGTFTYEKLGDGRYRSGSTLKAGERELTESAEYTRVRG